MSLHPTQTTVKTKTATIADNGTTSTEIDLENGTLCGFYTPAGLVGTAITFTVSTETGGTFVGVEKQDGSALTYTVEASKYYYLNPADFAGVRFIKLVSGSSETGGPLTFTIVYRIME